MKQLCANAGVAVALVREMKKVPWNGATKWLTPNKAMILLSLRGKGEDKFWFSFFHEAGHVLKDKKKGLFINDESNDQFCTVARNECPVCTQPSEEVIQILAKIKAWEARQVSGGS
jgi:hypothetical protein